MNAIREFFTVEVDGWDWLAVAGAILLGVGLVRIVAVAS